MKIQTSLTKLSAIAALAIILSTVNAGAATFTVTNKNDSGAGSLRQAILDSNATAGSDTINFDSSFNSPKTITLAATITIDPATGDSLTINGPAADLLTVSGNDAVQIFFVNTADTVSISGITLTKGRNNNGGAAIDNRGTLSVADAVFTSNFGNNGGGAIITQGALTVSNSIFDSNSTSFDGGAISVTATGSATVSNSTFSNHTVPFGGAIANAGSLTVANCTFTNNSATSSSATGLGGGAIYNGSDPTGAVVTISGSTFTGNAEVGNSGGGGAVRNRSGSMTITNSIFTSNTGVAGGGAIQNTDVLSISGSTFTGNIASGPNAQVSGQGSGGAISNQGAGQLTITNSVITGNSAVNDGGGIYFQPNSQSGPFLTITNTTISNNVCNTDGTSGSTTGDGGGIYTTNGGGTIPVNISRSTISGNRAIHGGTTINSGNGGGIYAIQQLTLDSTTISGNVAGLDGGGIFDTYPGSINSRVVITNSTIVSNTAAGNGGGIRSSNSVGDTPTSLANTIVANNIANGGTSQDVLNPVVSQGYNLIEDTSGTTITGTTTGNITGVDPLLDPSGLQDNGGLTQTIALQANSPAIDKGNSFGLTTDQRGLPRPFNNLSIPNATGGDGSDIGAFEDQPANTMPGSNVTVEAPAGDATVTFHSITKAGFTTFDSIVPPSSAGAPPEGYTILDGAPAYDINTTATFTAPITVCFTVSTIMDEAKFTRVRILHGENGELVDRTDLASIDFANHTVCAAVDSLSPFVVALAPTLPNRLQNISTRLRVETGDNVLIGGFIVLGTDTKTVILRAIGPSLADFGVTGALADPVLELHSGDGSLITSNDNWKTTQKAAIIATGIPPTNDKESAIVAELEPGNYTLVVKGRNGGTGVGLVEAYDLAATADSEFANISTRGKVATGTDVMIGGFILGGGTGDNTVLVRALGPSLSDAGVSGALADPTLELRDRDGNLVRSNDNWKDDQMAAIVATGIPPTKNLESALVQTLGPGNYTAIVAGKNGGIGVGLVEAYRLQ